MSDKSLFLLFIVGLLSIYFYSYLSNPFVQKELKWKLEDVMIKTTSKVIQNTLQCESTGEIEKSLREADMFGIKKYESFQKQGEIWD